MSVIATEPCTRSTSAPAAAPVRVVLPSTGRWARLLVASGRGEEASFEILAQEARGVMRLQALRVLNDVEDADEVVQESLLEAWCKANRYDPRRSGAGTWLSVIVRCRAIDLVRKTAARRAREARAVSLAGLVDIDDTADSSMVRADHDSVRTALSILSDLQREAVRLVYYEGLTSVQAAARLGIPVPTMKSRLHDGIGRLRGAVVGAGLDQRVDGGPAMAGGRRMLRQVPRQHCQQ